MAQLCTQHIGNLHIRTIYLHNKPEHAALAILVWQVHMLCNTQSLRRSYGN
jgi:hypothetical protein